MPLGAEPLRRRGQRQCVLLIAIASMSACSQPAGEQDPKAAYRGTIVLQDAGFQRPTAVIYDEQTQSYLVANAPASPSENGFITRVSARGRIRVQQLRWIDGNSSSTPLVSPMSMAVRNDTLFITDDGCIRFFHRTTGSPYGAICPPGLGDLIGLTVDRSGRMYVVANAIPSPAGVSGRDAVFRLDSGRRLSVAAEGDQLGRPGGVAAGPWGLFVTSNGASHVLQITSDGLRPVLSGNRREMGGIVATRNGSFALGSPSDSLVFFIERSRSSGRGSVWTLARGVGTPSQLGYDPHRERILLTDAGRNRLVVIELSPPNK